MTHPRASAASTAFGEASENAAPPLRPIPSKRYVASTVYAPSGRRKSLRIKRATTPSAKHRTIGEVRFWRIRSAFDIGPSERTGVGHYSRRAMGP